VSRNTRRRRQEDRVVHTDAGRRPLPGDSLVRGDVGYRPAHTRYARPDRSRKTAQPREYDRTGRQGRRPAGTRRRYQL